MKLYLFITEGDVEPQIQGPFKSEAQRSVAAKAHKRENGDNDGIFMLDVDSQGVPTTYSYSNGFFEED